jgi:hypothetical protein
MPTQVIATSIQPSDPTPTATEIFATFIIDVSAHVSTWLDAGISIQNLMK